MKTLQIGLDWFPERAGGLQRYFYDLLQAAPALGIDVKGVVAGSPRVDAETDGRVVAFGAMGDPLWSRLFAVRRAIDSTIKTYDPDLVVSHFALYTWPSLDLLDRPLVVHFHGPWGLEGEVERNGGLRQSAKAWVERAVYRKAARCIVLSQAFGEILHKQYRIPQERIRVIAGGVDLNRFDVQLSCIEARGRLGWPTDRPILLSVRRLVRRMGLENLIEAMSEVARAYPDVLLLIGGRGPLASELADEIAARGLQRNIRLVGFISDDDLPLAYRAADISIVPTTALEGFGLIAAESLAAGTPVLVTPVGGLPEVVSGLSEALMFPGVSSKVMAHHIVGILSGSVKLPCFGACQIYARNRFGWENIIKNVKHVYEEAL